MQPKASGSKMQSNRTSRFRLPFALLLAAVLPACPLLRLVLLVRLLLKA